MRRLRQSTWHQVIHITAHIQCDITVHSCSAPSTVHGCCSEWWRQTEVWRIIKSLCIKTCADVTEVWSNMRPCSCVRLWFCDFRDCLTPEEHEDGDWNGRWCFGSTSTRTHHITKMKWSVSFSIQLPSTDLLAFLGKKELCKYNICHSFQSTDCLSPQCMITPE